MADAYFSKMLIIIMLHLFVTDATEHGRQFVPLFKGGLSGDMTLSGNDR